MNKNGPWLKLFALMVVGGVAKALFDDREVVHHHYNNKGEVEKSELKAVED